MGRRHEDWLRQAENDLEWAKYSMEGGFHAQVCSICQQAGEKALKAYCLSQGYDTIRTHSLFQIIKSLGENGVLVRCARELDIYYVSARYPDALPAGAPFRSHHQGAGGAGPRRSDDHTGNHCRQDAA